MGNTENLKLDPPIWLWTHVNEAWEKTGIWVEYRQKPEAKEFYHEAYGLYFQKLYDYGIKRKLIAEKHESKEAPHAIS
jgi:hypothetical protein